MNRRSIINQRKYSSRNQEIEAMSMNSVMIIDTLLKMGHVISDTQNRIIDLLKSKGDDKNEDKE